MTRERWLVPVVWAALAVNVPAQDLPSTRFQRSGNGASSSTQPISQVAAATWTTRVDQEGQHALQLLVVWRGQPGWFLGGRNAGSSSSGWSRGGERTFNATHQYGDTTLRVHFDMTAGAAEIQGQRIDLGDHNVVLVDDVDVAGRLKVASLLRVDPMVPLATQTRPDIEALIARSAELVSFLRCDARPSTEARLVPFARFCERILRSRALQTGQ